MFAVTAIMVGSTNLLTGHTRATFVGDTDVCVLMVY
jgi:hypothetical protein